MLNSLTLWILLGKNFNTPILEEFVEVWINMFTRSPKTKTCMVNKDWVTGLLLHNRLLMILLVTLNHFLKMPPSRLKLLEILNNAPKNRKLQIELTVIIDAGEQFVKATYRLEGDGPLIFSAYEETATLRDGISNEYYPKLIIMQSPLNFLQLATRNNSLSIRMSNLPMTTCNKSLTMISWWLFPSLSMLARKLGS